MDYQNYNSKYIEKIRESKSEENNWKIAIGLFLLHYIPILYIMYLHIPYFIR